jgi:predicted O-methyltransferase YrrM
VLRDVVWADERFLARVTGGKPADIRRYLEEPAATTAFRQHILGSEETFRKAGTASAALYGKKVLIQYAVVRALKPSVVLETGVASGVSSAYLLLALLRNDRGILHSIDCNDQAYLPPNQTVGWIVPEALRSRWHLHLGDASQLLSVLLRELGEIDIFIHDSLHSYEHMHWEFHVAYPHIRPGGLLLADDATWNSAFPEFAREVKSAEARIIRGVGVLKKHEANGRGTLGEFANISPQASRRP